MRMWTVFVWPRKSKEVTDYNSKSWITLKLAMKDVINFHIIYIRNKMCKIFHGVYAFFYKPLNQLTELYGNRYEGYAIYTSEREVKSELSE